MDETQLRAVLARCGDDFARFCRREGLPLPESPIDKYGSYVLETGAMIDGLNRYISLAVTPDEDGKRLHFEAHTAADDGQRYWAGHTSADTAFVGDFIAHLGRSPFGTLAWLWEVYARAVRPEDLTEEYVVPRPAPDEVSVDAPG